MPGTDESDKRQRGNACRMYSSCILTQEIAMQIKHNQLVSQLMNLTGVIFECI